MTARLTPRQIFMMRSKKVITVSSKKDIKGK